jgi:hypothetical protein
MDKLKYLKMKEKYLSLKNQSAGAFTPPQGVQQSEEQRTRREASERAALLSVNFGLVLQEVDRVRDALRERRTPDIDKLPSEVFFNVLSFLSLKELSDMFIAFNQPNSKEFVKARNIKYFIRKRVEKILEYLKKKRDIIKTLDEEDIRVLDKIAFEELEIEVHMRNFNYKFLMRSPSEIAIREEGYLGYYFRQAMKYSPVEEVDRLREEGFFDLNSSIKVGVIHEGYKINDDEVDNAIDLKLIHDRDIPRLDSRLLKLGIFLPEPYDPRVDD